MNNTLFFGIMFMIAFITAFVIMTPLSFTNAQSEELNKFNRINFLPWGNSHLILNDLSNETALKVWRITGITSDNNAGYNAYFNSNSKFIVFNLADIEKTPTFKQITLLALLNGTSGQDYELIFINGRIKEQGWQNNTYYKKILPFSSNLIDMEKIISEKGDNYSSIKKITLSFERDTIINKFDFQILVIDDSISNKNELGFFSTPNQFTG